MRNIRKAGKIMTPKEFLEILHTTEKLKDATRHCTTSNRRTNGVFEENRKAKHGRDAKNGWYRYDTRFALPVYGDDGNIERYNIFRGRLLIRYASSGKKYLYDILEIKKEIGKSCQT